MAPAADFYLRYYVGHKGKFGHEFLEFEFRPDGQVCRSGLGRFQVTFIAPLHHVNISCYAAKSAASVLLTPLSL